jgi:cytochrome c oxidase subunit 2
MRKRPAIFAMSAFMAIGLLLGGCGSDNGGAAPSGSQSSSSGSSGSSTGTSGTTIHVTASNWQWTLDKTQFKAGQPVTFVVSSKEGVHGFAIDGTNVNTTVSPGSDQTVTWTPDKPGTYSIRCSIMCGTGHGNMVATVTVQ